MKKKISLLTRIFGKFYRIIETNDLEDGEILKIYIRERNDKKC